MAKFELTDGSLRLLMRGGKVDDPIMQVLGSKKIASTSEKERYRMLLSDGRYLISYAMLHTFGQEIAKYSIVKLKRYVTSVINNNTSVKNDRRVLVIMELDVLQEGIEVGETIGDPQQMTDDDVTDINGTEEPAKAAGNGDVPPAKRPATQAAVQASKTSSVINNADISISEAICPIASLSPYQNRWAIKVLVTNKTPLKQWSNSRGSGCLFSMDLMDNSGEIRCTAFRELAEKYHSLIQRDIVPESFQVDKMYYISKCQIKPANKQFSTINNDYEMTVGNESIVQECNDVDNTVSTISMYNFVSLDQIKDRSPGSLIDVIGICKGAAELVEFTAKTSGKQMKKREIFLLDQSNHEIALALWGDDAEEFTSAAQNPIVVIRGAKVGEYMGGKNITTSGSSVKINPEIPMAYKLRGWFDTRDKDVVTTNLSTRTDSGGSFHETAWMTFREVAETQNMGSEPRGDYFQLFGTVALVKSDKMTYQACPQAACNKKVLDLENGMYKCEKCDMEFPNFKYRMLPSMNIVDATGDQWVSMFNETGEKVFGVSAEEVGEACLALSVDRNNESLAQIVQNVTFKYGLFKMRAKKENYNDEMRLKTIVTHFEPLKPEHNQRPITEIENLTGLKITNDN